jgi:hypothetical protein
MGRWRYTRVESSLRGIPIFNGTREFGFQGGHAGGIALGAFEGGRLVHRK